MEQIIFRNSTVATNFENFAAQMNVTGLVLGGVSAYGDVGGIVVSEILKRLVSQWSVEQLTLRADCLIENFQAALEAGKASVIELWATINCDKDDNSARLHAMASFIRGAIKLNSLTIVFRRNTARLGPQPELLQAVEACATLTHIEVHGDQDRHCFTLCELQQQQRITSRNRELARFVASPNINLAYNVLARMRHFDNCPSGRYMLACRLPEVLSFEHIIESTDSSTKPIRKRRKLE